MISTIFVTLFATTAFSHNVSLKSETVLTNLAQAKAVGGLILSKDEATGTAVAYLDQL